VTLRAVVDSLDDIPEGLRDEYVEHNGKFYLDLDDTLSVHTSIVPLSTALANAKKEKQRAQNDYNALRTRIAGLPDDFDADKYQQVLDELETLRADPNGDHDAEAKLTTLRDKYEQRLRDAEAKRVADLAEKDGVIDSLGGELDGAAAKRGLSDALAKAGIDPKFMAAAQALLRPTVKVRKNETTGDREAVVDTDLGEVTVEKYVENWAKSDEGKPFVLPSKGSGAPGSGHTGRTEVNPWAKDTLNLTEQGRVIQSDRAKAERLMKAAGKTADEISRVLGRAAA